MDLPQEQFELTMGLMHLKLLLQIELPMNHDGWWNILIVLVSKFKVIGG